MTQSASSRLPRADTILAVVGVVAFVGGVTDEWIIGPIADWFGDLSPGNKVLVTAVVVAAAIGSIVLRRRRRRVTVQSAASTIGHPTVGGIVGADTAATDSPT